MAAGVETTAMVSRRSSSANCLSWRSVSRRKSAGSSTRSSKGVSLSAMRRESRYSVDAVDQTARQSTQEIGRFIKNVKRANRLVDKQTGLFGGPFNPKDCHERGLAGGRVQTHRLAGGVGVANHIQQIVGDLKGQAEFLRETVQSGAGARSGLAQSGAGAGRKSEQLAGFDAHHDDPLAEIHLDEDDYVWITREIMAIADGSAGGRLISSLEGGYDLAALGRSVAAHVATLMNGGGGTGSQADHPGLT